MTSVRNSSEHSSVPTKIVLRPTILELLRFKKYNGQVVLLLDRVSTVETGGKRGFRLWLTDGRKSIQAVLDREIHHLFGSGWIEEGRYISLTDYQLSRVDKLNGVGHVFIIIIMGMYPIDPEELLLNQAGAEVASSKSAPSDQSRHLELQARRDSPSCEELSRAPSIGSSRPSPNGQRPENGASDEKFDRLSTEPTTSQKRSFLENSSPLDRSSEGAITPSNKRLKVSPQSLPMDAPRKIRELQPITRPLQITPLSQLVNMRTIRNKIYDVLAIVCSVDADVIRRPRLPLQRNLRITDTSTTKRVQLTVFVDAENFTPRVGTIALFRNVTTHEWNGGSLKAYKSDCEGRIWFVPDPEDVEQDKINALKDCLERG